MCGSFGQTYENKDSLGCQTSHESPASFGGGKFKNAPTEGDMQEAIAYLKKRPSYFSALNDDRQIEEAFRNNVIGKKHRALLDDNNEVRDELEKKFPGDAYQWYPSVRVKDIIEKFAENKYYTGEAHDKVTEQVMRMPDEEAKRLLIELLDKNYEVGLKLLEES